MTDVELRTFLRAQLLAIMPLYGITGVPVIASNQPTSEGRETGPAIYFHSLDEQREGWQSRQYDRDLIDQGRQTESQIFASTMQVSVLAPETANLTLPQATDICRAASMALQSRQFIDAMAEQYPDAGVRRITAVRRPYIVNDAGQFEMVPSFDVTITHTVKFITTAPEVDSTRAVIHRV
jgi:hypothetical protein